MKKGIKIITEYLEEVSSSYVPKAIYRGHADIDWQVAPSIWRENARPSISGKEGLRVWRRNAGPFVMDNKPQSDIEWLILAQHYGIPTPLLDWTSNPLVGLYFACNQNYGKSATDGAVWQLDCSELKRFEKLSTILPFKNRGKDIPIITSRAVTRRTVLQDSVMTLHPDRQLSRLPKKTLKIIYKVNGKDKEYLLDALKILGFDISRMYGDLQAVCDGIADELRYASGQPQ
jgi:hypothetical protein